MRTTSKQHHKLFQNINGSWNGTKRIPFFIRPTDAYVIVNKDVPFGDVSDWNIIRWLSHTHTRKTSTKPLPTLITVKKTSLFLVFILSLSLLNTRAIIFFFSTIGCVCVSSAFHHFPQSVFNLHTEIGTQSYGQKRERSSQRRREKEREREDEKRKRTHTKPATTNLHASSKFNYSFEPTTNNWIHSKQRLAFLGIFRRGRKWKLHKQARKRHSKCEWKSAACPRIIVTKYILVAFKLTEQHHHHHHHQQQQQPMPCDGVVPSGFSFCIWNKTRYRALIWWDKQAKLIN